MVDEMLEFLRTARERPVWRPVPAEVRKRLSGAAPRGPAATRWFFVPGGSLGTLGGWAVAGTAGGGLDVGEGGLQNGGGGGGGGGAAPRLSVYASTETHSSVRKAVELLGLGHDALRAIPVTADYTIDVQALRATIAADKAKGLRPICIVGNAGTVNTGATDDLHALAAVSRAENLWFHVD